MTAAVTVRVVTVSRPADTAPMQPTCHFCSAPTDPARTMLHSSENVAAFLDHFPSAEGHMLVVPRRHVARVEDLTEFEYRDLFLVARQLITTAKDTGTAPEGYTIGINDGPVAGQTVPHVHLHLIPRRSGDTADPRGGIRWAIPETAAYWN